MLTFFKFFNFKFFLFGLLFGIVAMNYYDSDDRIIHVYPNPENVNIIQYKDNANTCFNINDKIVPCPIDESLIHTIPVQ